MAITRTQQARQMYKKGSKKPVVQGGVDNYLGDQPQVVVPRNWQSGPDKPPTELAYITEAEKKLLLKEDIHGSLKDGPNKGPAGVMSLDSFGDIGGGGSAGVDTSPSGGASGDDRTQFSGRTVSEMRGGREADQERDRRIANEKARLQIAERKQAERLGYDERENIADYGSADPLQRLYMRGVSKSSFPGFIGMGLNALTPFRNFSLRKNIDYFRDLEDVESKGYPKTLEGYKQYMQDRLAGKIDAAGNPNPGYGKDDGPDQPIIPMTTPDDPGEGDDEETSPGGGRDMGGLAPRFEGSIFDFTGLADGGRVPAMGGGIMNTDIIGGAADGNIDEMGRQMYFVGKLVKKATRAVKKIAKSPLGKAAIIGGLGYLGATKFGGLSGLKGTLFGQAGSRVGQSFIPYKEGLLTKLGLTKGGGSLMPTLKGGLALATLAPFVFQGDEEEENFDPYRGPSIDIANIRANPYNFLAPRFQGSTYAADGGLMRMGYQEGGDAEPVAKKTMPLIDMDGKEKDYRETGGFVDMGRMERADDVPARLSKNEFVFTADAVRNAGEGDIDKGAEVMYNMMKNLEAGGEVSEESQGLEGAREMFKTSQRLEEVI